MTKPNDEPLVPWKEIATQSIDRTEALEAERDGFRAEVGLLLLSVKTFEAERDELRADNVRLRAALAAHHRLDFPNLDRTYTCRECGFDGTDVPTQQAYALAIENDCDADD